MSPAHRALLQSYLSSLVPAGKEPEQQATQTPAQAAAGDDDEYVYDVYHYFESDDEGDDDKAQVCVPFLQFRLFFAQDDTPRTPRAGLTPSCN